MEDINIRFAKRLKALREKHKFTQEELAEAAGIDYKHVQDMEGKNPSAPTLTTLAKLAKAFKVSVSKLLDF